MKPSYMAIKKVLYGRQSGYWFLFLVFCRFFVCVFSLIWFENKVPRFVHLGGKDEIFSGVAIFYAILFTRKIT
jgi:hypothetical protein